MTLISRDLTLAFDVMIISSLPALVWGGMMSVSFDWGGRVTVSKDARSRNGTDQSCIYWLGVTVTFMSISSISVLQMLVCANGAETVVRRPL